VVTLADVKRRELMDCFSGSDYWGSNAKDCA